MSSRPPHVMLDSGIKNSGLLITRTLHRHKHQLRDFFNRHVLTSTIHQLRAERG